MASDTQEAYPPKAALITGASAGIGTEFARLLAAEGRTLLITARRADRLETLAQELRAAHGVRVEIAPLDLVQPGTPLALADKAAALGLDIDLLVNNAGFGLRGGFTERPLDRQVAIAEVNMTALTRLTGLFLPAMLERRSGGIINVASIAAFLPGPYMSVYYASKAYVLSFSEAIAYEARRSGVVVTALCPGATESEFAEVAGFAFPRRLERTVMTAREVARLGLKGHRAGKRVVITGAGNKLLVAASRLMPRGLMTSLMGAAQKNLRGATALPRAGAAS
jgi:short-subunit dehydrogenase